MRTLQLYAIFGARKQERAMTHTAAIDGPGEEEKTYLYLIAYTQKGEAGEPVVIKPGVAYTSIHRLITAFPFKIDSAERLRILEEALEKKGGKPFLIIGISPLF